MPKQELLLDLVDLSVHSAGGRIRELNLSAGRNSLLLISAEDHRRIASLFRVIKGLDQPLDGGVSYRGERIGLVLADDELPDYSTPRQELALYGSLNGLALPELQAQLSRWDLEGIHHLACRFLSPYETEALLIAMETAAQPELLLCEEPLAGLTPKQSARMLEELRHYAAEHLVIIGTVQPDHYPKDLPRISLEHQTPGREFSQAWVRQTSPAQSGSLAAKEPPDSAALIQESIPAESLPPETMPPESGSVRPVRTRNPAKTQHRPIPQPGLDAGIGPGQPVTVRIRLPVDPDTDYQLRRISEIKYFQPSPDHSGYEVDILEADREQLPQLLKGRGLVMEPAEEEQA